MSKEQRVLAMVLSRFCHQVAGAFSALGRGFRAAAAVGADDLAQIERLASTHIAGKEKDG